MPYKTPEWDELVQVSRGDLFLLVECARSYDSRLPHGMVPLHIRALLTDDMRRSIEERGPEPWS